MIEANGLFLEKNLGKVSSNFPTINFPIHSPSLLLKTFTESPDLSLKTFNNLCNTLEFKFILAFLDNEDSEYILVLNL